ncbi:hypothetical protein SADUNF_Sadunf18G0071800 [Salix dunnii]|uniref:Uncharacterized protein n=1 Tax=Salix dunnii TaxID=1413687 RepID=A0A835J4F6_9ROSI|nr:hypothetical protein SADUNF_Sadunf18G0071800 [Salix dunnii]
MHQEVRSGCPCLERKNIVFPDWLAFGNPCRQGSLCGCVFYVPKESMSWLRYEDGNRQESAAWRPVAQGMDLSVSQKLVFYEVVRRI